ncbi:type II toxin-antitoxin system VapC family toxin [Duganella sp. BJB1802]|uniref:type II toxin-antitoxin system VapC family toxin n=1 Tax=Duganella sp. BJB1802 TaxID=2744575 RepID=UPI001594A686|nr:type II toxin-antitoxin system VapC family toxin [Duganella sp. BJB1802]NVD68989.1 type II toxin-antitoxin system VapC family toxin [Duganella sp. BJB1802]
MILADTSVWINHFRRSDQQLMLLLKRNQLLVHPFVIGELAMGNLADRNRFLKTLRDLPQSIVISNDEVILFVGLHALYGTGLSLIDAHLLAVAGSLPGIKLWTCDRRLRAASTRLGVCA